MNGKKIFKAIRDIDPRLILDAAPTEKSYTSRLWVKWGTLAACLCLVVAAVFLFLPNGSGSLFPHIHVFGEWQTTKNASCSAKGEETRVCVCGEKEIRYTAVLSHFAGEWVVEKEPTIKIPTPDDPNEREPGLKCQFCERCGAKLNEELIPATGSLGLAYAINPDEKTFAVAGIGNCTDTEIIIPENFCGYHVTAIGKNAFSGCDQIKSIIFPETITLIDERALNECRSLESITLPEGLTEIGAQAFSYCRLLKEIIVPQSVTKIGRGAFSDIFYLEKVVLSDAVEEIPESLFASDPYLKEVTLPPKITGIGDYAFSRCSSLKSIDIPETVTSIGDGAFEQCGLLTSMVLPDGIDSIGYSTFAYCQRLVSIRIPNSVTSIGANAFSRCYALTDIHIPQGVTQIGADAFLDCYSLTHLTLPEGLVGIEHSTFYGCVRLTELNIPDSVKYIESRAFYGCEKLLQVENNVSYVDNWAVEFQHGVTDVVLREGTVGIARWTFQTPGILESITLPDSIKYIGERAISYNGRLKQIIFDGTQEQWDAVEKEQDWNKYAEEVKIVCKKS
ncbi:MAG: leucine-rich repeat domain-containing protein [Ruminococcaceae bacterium]|nr:leucine-rich repeat domain-containing protein [Oscillospiraceae bacterium]